MKKLKLTLKIALWLLLAGLISLFACDIWVRSFASDKCTFQLDKIHARKVGLLLGTSKYLANGWENQYYTNRIDAVERLFKKGKIKFILISGDNSTPNYNEPQMMKEDLMKRGIPESRIFLDYAGFRTLDSVVRCEQVFGEKDVIVISQRFHNERSIFIADSYGIKMQGYNAKDVNKMYGFKTNLREKFARVKVVLDLIFGTGPRFLGKKIAIN